MQKKWILIFQHRIIELMAVINPIIAIPYIVRSHECHLLKSRPSHLGGILQFQYVVVLGLGSVPEYSPGVVRTARISSRVGTARRGRFVSVCPDNDTTAHPLDARVVPSGLHRSLLSSYLADIHRVSFDFAVFLMQNKSFSVLLCTVSSFVSVSFASNNCTKGFHVATL